MKNKGAMTGLACALVGCVTTGGRVCEPTGWVDRVEAGIVVVAEDGKEEDSYLPAPCFPEPAVAGTRVVKGRVDWEETHAVAKEIAALIQEMESPEP